MVFSRIGMGFYLGQARINALVGIKDGKSGGNYFWPSYYGLRPYFNKQYRGRTTWSSGPSWNGSYHSYFKNFVDRYYGLVWMEMARTTRRSMGIFIKPLRLLDSGCLCDSAY